MTEILTIATLLKNVGTKLNKKNIKCRFCNKKFTISDIVFGDLARIDHNNHECTCTTCFKKNNLDYSYVEKFSPKTMLLLNNLLGTVLFVDKKKVQMDNVVISNMGNVMLKFKIDGNFLAGSSISLRSKSSKKENLRFKMKYNVNNYKIAVIIGGGNFSGFANSFYGYTIF